MAEIDVERLSEDAVETLVKVARPMSEDGKTPAQLSVELGWEPREISRRLQLLGDEMKALAGILDLPPLTADEYEALRDSIAASGQLVPILVDERGSVIDGSNRLRACTELGLDPWFAPALTGTADELRHLALVVNVARRHLTAGARRGLVADELRRDATRSDRAIAGEVGVSPTTVGVVRQELVDAGSVSRVDTRTGVDGKQQTAAKVTLALPVPFAGTKEPTITIVCPECGHEFPGE